jgi:uncharacterized membrane protein
MTSGTVRHAYLDWVRGVAVLIMIEAHVLDSWTHAADRARPLFGYAIILGGFGAPLFLFLAGIVAVLSAEAKVRKSRDFAASWRAAQMRGWQLFGLAFLFRLQSFVLSGANNAIDLLKVDILNIMGPAIAVAAVLGSIVRRSGSRAVLFAGAAAAMSVLTPFVRGTPLLAWLPDPVEWYFRPVPGRTNFTLFPWAGFVFAGSAVGVVLAAFRSPERSHRIQIALGTTGILLVWLAYQASFLPSMYARTDFWTTSLSFFFLRVGLLILVLPLGYLWAHAPFRHKLSTWSPLEVMGSASLFVYWIHVEMVYGFFSRPIRRSLGLEAAVAAYVLFTLFLLGLVGLKSAIVKGRAIYLTDNKSVI